MACEVNMQGISTENLTATYNEWKIQNFLSWAKERQEVIHSPPYLFLGADFIFKLQVNGIKRYMDMGLARTTTRSCNARIHLQYQIGVKKHDGTEFKCWSESHTFGCNGCSGRLWERVDISEIQREGNVVGPDGALILFCTLCAKRTGSTEEEVQTEPTEGIYKCIEEKSTDSEAEDSTGGDVKSRFNVRTGVNQLSNNFKALFLNEEHCDVLVKVRGKEFKAHRAILVARSAVFSSTFKHDTMEKKSGIIEITDCEPDVFQKFLFYLYTGKVKNVLENYVHELYFMADKYDVKDLKSECMKFMQAHISVDSICDIITLALRHNESALLQSATDFFEKNAKRIIVTTRWISFLKEYPIEANELNIKALDYSNSMKNE